MAGSASRRADQDIIRQIAATGHDTEGDIGEGCANAPKMTFVHADRVYIAPDQGLNGDIARDDLGLVVGVVAETEISQDLGWPQMLRCQSPTEPKVTVLPFRSLTLSIGPSVRVTIWA